MLVKNSLCNFKINHIHQIFLFINKISLCSQNMDPISKQRSGPNKGIWHYTPPLPLAASPYFHWPLDLVAIVKWIYNAWLPLSERLIILVIAIVTWLYLYPDLEQTQTLSECYSFFLN